MDITIIIPCHNSEPFINGIIEDLNQQTFKSFKVVFVDDSSDILLKDCLPGFKINFEYQIVECNCKNPGEARNVGLQYVDTEYMYFVDSDDRISENFLEYSIKTLKNFTESQPFAIKIEVMSNELLNKVSYKYEVIKKSLDTLSLLGRTIFKSEIIQKNNIRFKSLRHFEDFLFISEYLYSAKIKSLVKHSAIFYRVLRKDSVSHDFSRLKPAIKVFEETLQEWKDKCFNKVFINKLEIEIENTKEEVSKLNNI